MQKVVIDTNIWISFFIKKKSAELVKMVEDHNLLICCDINLRTELAEVINRQKFKKYLTPQNIKDALFIFDTLTTLIKTKKTFTGSPDAKDDFLFDLAH